MNYNLVAYLPIKENSQRIPNKNFKSFLGKALYEWILEKLLAVPSIQKIYINTDANILLTNNKILKNKKIELIKRKEELCGDNVSMNKIIDDDLNFIDSKAYLMTHVTNPFLSVKTLSKAIDIYNHSLNEGYDSLFSVNEFRSRFYDISNNAINHNPKELIQTQDLPPIFEENSNLYIFSKESFLATRSRIGKYPIHFTTPKIESIDIDYPEDWLLAEAIGKNVILKR